MGEGGRLVVKGRQPFPEFAAASAMEVVEQPDELPAVFLGGERKVPVVGEVGSGEGDRCGA